MLKISMSLSIDSCGSYIFYGICCRSNEVATIRMSSRVSAIQELPTQKKSPFSHMIMHGYVKPPGAERERVVGEQESLLLQFRKVF